jgi:hypothetical protein
MGVTLTVPAAAVTAAILSMLPPHRSEADLWQPATQDCASTKTPRASAASDALLRASEDIPNSFLQRQAYFARLAQEKRQLLALALEDEHCAFNPSATPRCSSRASNGSHCAAMTLSATFSPKALRFEHKALTQHFMR